MIARRRLPNRREHELINFRHGGFDYIAGIGRFEDGAIAEIFLDVAKSGTVIESWANDAALVASLALQFGAPLQVVRHALSREHDGSPASPLCMALDLLAETAPSVAAAGGAL